MSLLKIVQYPDPILRRYCLPVQAIDDALVQLAQDMLDTMYDAPGRGLAAPQVGVALRLFVMDTTWREGTPAPRVCLNPEITGVSDHLVAFTEGCLSIPDIPARVLRPREITLRWFDLDGAQHEETMSGFDAVCAQHEFDHLNGRLAIDLMGEVARAEAAEALMKREALA